MSKQSLAVNAIGTLAGTKTLGNHIPVHFEGHIVALPTVVRQRWSLLGSVPCQPVMGSGAYACPLNDEEVVFVDQAALVDEQGQPT